MSKRYVYVTLKGVSTLYVSEHLCKMKADTLKERPIGIYSVDTKTKEAKGLKVKPLEFQDRTRLNIQLHKLKYKA